MKSINIDEEIKNIYLGETWSNGGGNFKLATKRDILRSVMNDLYELKSEWAMDNSNSDVGFLDWLEALVNEKGDTV